MKLQRMYVSILLIVAATAIAQSAEPDAEQEAAEIEALKDCGANQAAMNLCANHKIRQADAELNELYRRQLARLKGTADEARLRAAQRAWLKYVEADCLYSNGPAEDGGSSWAMSQAYCRAGHMAERIKYLRSYVECTSGGCPGGGE